MSQFQASELLLFPPPPPLPRQHIFALRHRNGGNVKLTFYLLLLSGFLLSGIAKTRAADATADVWNVSTNAGAWLTPGNWSLGTVPTGAQTAQFGTNPTSSPFNVGINMNGATNNGANNQIVGAIDITSARSNPLVIGNSSTTANGTLTLAGVTVNGVDNTIINNSSNTFSELLTIQNTAGGGNKTMSIALGNATDNVISTSNQGRITISSTITGAGKNLTINPYGGAVTLSGLNTYSGITTIHKGAVNITSLANINTASSIGTGSAAGSAADLVLAGGNGPYATLSYAGSTAISTNRLFTIGDSIGYAAALENNSASTSSTMSFTSTGPIPIGTTQFAALLLLEGSNTGNNTFAPVLGNGVYGTGLIKDGPGTWIITGANTYTGTTSIYQGTLTVNPGGTIGGSTVPLTVGIGFPGANVVLNLNVDQTVGELRGDVSGPSTATINIAIGKTLTVNQSTSTTYAGVIASAGSLTKSGTGTLTLSGANTYTGTTIISGGTLKLDNNNTTTPRLASTSRITVNSSGTLLFAQSGGTPSTDRIGNSVPITLNGGAINTGGFSEGTTPLAGVGALTLSSNSSIDLTSTSLLHIAASNGQTWAGTLNILNWNGMLVTGGGAEQILFGSNITALTAAQLLEIQFVNPAGLPAGNYFASWATAANGEIVPGPAVPEPATWFTAGLALLAIAHGQRRKVAAALKSR